MFGDDVLGRLADGRSPGVSGPDVWAKTTPVRVLATRPRSGSRPRRFRHRHG
jgi:hypothetical protein